MQKGIDLIADVFPDILEKHPHTQLICIGPTIDLYGRFAALKLDVMVRKPNLDTREEAAEMGIGGRVLIGPR